MCDTSLSIFYVRHLVRVISLNLHGDPVRLVRKPHLSEEQSEIQRITQFVQRHSARKRHSWDSNSGWLKSKTLAVNHILFSLQREE